METAQGVFALKEVELSRTTGKSITVASAILLLSACNVADRREPVSIPLSGFALEKYDGRWLNAEDLRVDFVVRSADGVMTVMVDRGGACQPLKAVTDSRVLTFFVHCPSGISESSLQYLPPDQGNPAVLTGHCYWAVREPGPLWQARNLVERHGLAPADLRESFIDWAARYL